MRVDGRAARREVARAFTRLKTTGIMRETVGETLPERDNPIF